MSPSTRKRGSKAFWPRVRAKRTYASPNSWDSKILPNDTNLLGFVGFKVGMTHIGTIDNFSHTITKGSEIVSPVTIIECPPIKVLSIKFLAYSENEEFNCVREISEIIKDKYLQRKIDIQKKVSKKTKVEEEIEFAKKNFVKQIKIKISTNPQLTGIGRKKPEILEIGVSGTIEEQITFALEKLGKTIKILDVFKGGELVDIHSVTTAKGFQGAVKRFGVKLTSHKSEKKRRHAGNVGAWHPARVLTTIPLAGQTGYHKRCEWNKWILKVSTDGNEMNPSSGFKKYGKVKNDYILVKGSIGGVKKRLITFVRSLRPNKRYPKIAPEITYIHK